MKINLKELWGGWVGRVGLGLGIALMLVGVATWRRPPRYVALSGVMVFDFTNIARIRLRAQEFKSMHPAVLQADANRIVSFRSGSNNSTASSIEGFSFSLLAIADTPTEAEQRASRAAEQFGSTLSDLIPEGKIHVTVGRPPRLYSPMRDFVLPFVSPVLNRWLPSGPLRNAWARFAERVGHWSLL